MLADIEITDFVESYLNDSSERVLGINKIHDLSGYTYGEWNYSR